MNWRKHLPKRAGMSWARLGPEDKDPKVIQVIDENGLHAVQLGVTGSLPLKEFARSKPDALQFYGPMRVPKTPIPRRDTSYEPPRDPVTERFEKQSDPKVVLGMVNDYLRQMPEETRRKIPRTLMLPARIADGQELEAVFERLDEAAYGWGMENDADNPALDEVAHFLRAAWFQFEQIAIDAEPFEDPER